MEHVEGLDGGADVFVGDDFDVGAEDGVAVGVVVMEVGVDDCADGLRC